MDARFLSARRLLLKAGLVAAGCLTTASAVQSQYNPAPLPQAPQVPAQPIPGTAQAVPPAYVVSQQMPAPADAPKPNDPAFVAAVKAAVAQIEEDKKKADEQKIATEGYIIGSDTSKVGLVFRDGQLWASTPNKDFTMHIGFWMQMDTVYWGQSPILKTAPGGRPGNAQGVASGIAAGGVGTLEEGTYWRRIRPFIEGTFYENFEYRLNLALENNQFQTSGLDEVWVGMNNIPLVGTVRFGHVKNALGLEGDMTSSSRTMTFMERSSYSEAIELNQNFVTGLWFGNAFLNQRVSYQATVFYPDQGSSSGVYFGDGNWGANGRVTALPYYQDNGRELLHLGLSGGWRNGTSNLANSPDSTFQLRARPEMRDDDPAGSTTAGLSVPNANSNRMVDTGAIAANNDYLLGTELLLIRGPFSFQAEYGWNYLTQAYGVAPAGFVLNPKITPAQNYTFNGGYMQVSYILTGENRNYDKKNGCLARDYIQGGPATNAWFVRDENGGINWGIGAWEVAARWSYVDLNDGAGLNRIQGGQMQGLGLTLNWYLNRSIKVQFDYNYDYRYDLPRGTDPGYTSGFGTEIQLSF